MYRIWNRIFGWDYIVWKNCLHKGVDRVRVLPNGEPYFFQYGRTNLFCEITEENVDRGEIVAWLTCDKSKYLKPKQ